MTSDLRDAALDLLLGGACVGCGRPGRALCAPCRTSLRRAPVCAPAPAWPTPTPPGLVMPWAAAAYDGPVRELVLAHKERHVGGLALPLGRLLATAVAAALAGHGPARVLLVPVPSRPGAARSRGHDPLLDVVRRAAGLLPGAMVAPLLRSRGGVRDQAGLSATERAANLAGSMWCPSAGLRRLAGRPCRAVVCDDVLTTGATAREAQRALSASGVDVLAVATVAATVRRSLPRVHSELSAPPLSRRPAVD